MGRGVDHQRGLPAANIEDKMKALSLAIAIVAGGAALAPAVQAQPAAAKAAAESSHGLKIGDQLNAQYTRTLQYRIKDPVALGLPAPPVNFKWYQVDDTAYLVQDDTNLIVRFQKVTARAS